jgi:hypothetical protein
MAEIIDLSQRFAPKDNLLTAAPIEFRRGDWPAGYAMMCLRKESQRFETHRQAALGVHGHQHIGFVPTHISLDDGYHFTISGLFRHRADESLMRRTYRLAGLMECVTNASSSILRTDLLRHFYKTILDEREALQVFWRGNVQRFLLPVHPEYRHPNLFFNAIDRAETLKELYANIEQETDLLFDVLAEQYVFYVPESFR